MTLCYVKRFKGGKNGMNELPILKTTEMLTVRQSEGRQVFTYQDLAEGFAVSPVRLRNQYSRNIEAWSADETDVYQNGTPSGTQETRYFTARGAMRFCRYIKSGRSDALYNHLLDLWEQERGAVAALPRDPINEIDRAAQLIGQLAGVTAARLEAVDTRLTAIEVQQKLIDPRAIEERMFQLHQIKKALVDGTKDHEKPVNHPAFWQALKKHLKIASFQNRAALDVELMERGINYARNWCFLQGVLPPDTNEPSQEAASA
jgi:hypothetical protein